MLRNCSGAHNISASLIVSIPINYGISSINTTMLKYLLINSIRVICDTDEFSRKYVLVDHHDECILQLFMFHCIFHGSRIGVIFFFYNVLISFLKDNRFQLFNLYFFITWILYKPTLLFDEA